MKVIIPVAGIGSKLRPHTHTQPKALVPVAGKPILAHIVDNLIEAGMREFIFIVGYLGNKIEDYIKINYPGIEKSFLIQEPREGTGHAVWLAKKMIDKDDELVIALGDTIFDVNLREIIEKTDSALGVKKVDDPRSFGVAELDESGLIKNVIEKPPIPKSNLALVGLYKIKEGLILMEALEELIGKNERTQGEFHLTDGIMKMIEKGSSFKTFAVENWYDCGSKDSLLETNAMLLKKLNGRGSKHHFENTIIIHPVSIAENCKISNSIIGPNVSIGDHTIINHSILKDAIIGSYSELENAVLHHSVIGSDASLKGMSQSLNLGDSTEIDFG
ncbi:MAG: glucose-1-phosphate thymidylyltransferase [Bacteroidetes bacterium]|nr:MAG: glucose-1-phosphate thymidylyltransferase [Bacteroidota bacterium]REK07009.1 MAG: glucose-1-phosphate thymidylyltransferase [Bacteroidota bacterium]REK33644.1 MAG: glucose-1-phosphate thymidylyltransferase [Bacteroidota bacterium]REK48630.1 MAG: glucose-1-phosphate thymidylyltransferase [Bacteroidota bacterium]